MGIFKKRKYDDDNEKTIIDGLLENNDSNNEQEEEKTVTDFANMDFVFDPKSFKDSFNDIKRDSSTLDIIKKKVEKQPAKPEITEEPQVEETVSESTTAVIESLLEKCKAFTVDEKGNDAAKDEKPLYKLQSVDEILKSSQNKILEELSENFDIKIEDETKKPSEPEISQSNENQTKEIEKPSDEVKTSKTTEFIKMVSESVDKELNDDQKFEDYILTKKPDSVVDDLTKKIPDISDIDNTQKFSTKIHDHSTDEPTIRYVPTVDKNEQKDISVTSITQNLNFTNQTPVLHSENKKNTYTANTEILGNDFDDYTEENEIESKADISQYIVKFAKTKRTRFISLLFTVIALLTDTLLLLPTFNDAFLTGKTAMIVSFSVSMIAIIANLDMFLSFGKALSKTVTADLSVAVLSIGIAFITLFEIMSYDVSYAIDVYKLNLIFLFIISARCLLAFFDISTKLSNLKVLATKNDINAVDFIEDQSVALAIAKDSIDGDVLIAAPRKTDFVSSFNKYSNYNVLLNGKFVLVELTAILLAVFFGVIGYVHYGKIISAFFCGVSVLTVSSMAPLFFINTLPKYSASKRLNPKGAMISGIEGAEKIENANAVLLSTNDIFPDGTIVLKDIKVLSENSIDDTILKAASLTEAVGSTLAPIFKQIAKTNSSYTLPDSDTVKYEDRLGLSGWVDNELLFIGNRTLMESHGIEVPSFEVDKRILRNGCFPVYLATVDKACALIIVKYNPDFSIARQLRKITSLGITVLLTNCDQNITEQMIADNFDVYEDGIKLVTNAGKHMYETSMTPAESINSPAAFRRKNFSFVTIMNSASAIKKSNNLFSIFYIIASVILAVGYIYLSFIEDSLLPNANILLVSHLLTTVLSIILYLFKKP